MEIGQYKNESDAYRRARAELLQAERELRDRREQVAQRRRELPHDKVTDNYMFREGPRDLSAGDEERRVSLADLFDRPDAPLVLYQFMYGEAQENPCPSCTMWNDGLNAAARHVEQHINFATVAQAPLRLFRAFARSRQWRHLRLLSAIESSFKRDFNFADDKGNQYPGVSVFIRDADGVVHHTYSGSAVFDLEKNEHRGIDLLTPVWNIFDLTPPGRPDWYPTLDY